MCFMQAKFLLDLNSISMQAENDLLNQAIITLKRFMNNAICVED